MESHELFAQAGLQLLQVQAKGAQPQNFIDISFYPHNSL
jgi:hypothetical protein